MEEIYVVKESWCVGCDSGFYKKEYNTLEQAQKDYHERAKTQMLKYVDSPIHIRQEIGKIEFEIGKNDYIRIVLEKESE